MSVHTQSVMPFLSEVTVTMVQGENGKPREVEVPEITVGLPVFNGAETLMRALEQMRSQTFRKYRLVISDTASTDESQKICERYAAQDCRIDYVRSERRIPASANFRRVLMGAHTPYFMWISQDDIWHPEFMERCYGLLSRQPGVVCVVPRSVKIMRDGTKIIDKGTAPLRGEGVDRLRAFLRRVGGNHRYYGLYRTKALQRCFPIENWFFAYDWLVVALTTMEGDHDEVPEILFEKYANSTYHYFGHHGFEMVNVLDRVFPTLRFSRELQARVAPEVWRACLLPVIAINAEHVAQQLEYYCPWLKKQLQWRRALGRLWTR